MSDERQIRQPATVVCRKAWRFVLMCGLATSCQPFRSAGPPTDLPNGIVASPPIAAEETYFRYVPSTGSILLRGYKVGSRGQHAPQAAADEFKKAVARASFCRDTFGFERWVSVEERAYRRQGKGGDIVIFECDLKATDSDVSTILSDFFSHAFRRRVVVAVDDKELGVNYYDGRPVRLSESNSLGHRGNGQVNVIFWECRLPHYEAVFSLPGTESLHPFERQFGLEPVAGTRGPPRSR